MDKVFIDAEILGEAFDGADMMDLVALHGQAVVEYPSADGRLARFE